MSYFLSKLKITFLLAATALFTFTSCQKDDDEANSNNGGSNGSGGVVSTAEYLSGDLIEADFRGIVTDDLGQPVANALISIGTASTSTDSDGIWQVIGATVDEIRAYVRVEKDGYFHGSRVLIPGERGFNRVIIQLIPAEVTGSVSGTTGGEVTHNSGASVTLNPNGVVDANGDAYTGMVDVQICYLDPSSDEIFSQMPGNLTAQEYSNNFVALITYGMIGVELVGQAGEELQIADNSEATIKVPVPSSGLGTAPSSIPLWHFDEVAGIWREDGEALLTGDEYIGTVTHFSFWNCDVPTDAILLEGYVFGEEAAYPIQGVQIQLVSNDFGNGNAWSDQDGYFGGLVPAGVVLTMNVYSACGDLIFTQEIGPFNTDVMVPNIIYNETDNTTGYISGQMLDCGGIPGVGYLTAVNMDGPYPESVEVDLDGSFVMAVPCGVQTLDITGYAADYLTTSSTIQVTTIPGNTVDAGTIDLCEEAVDEFIIMNVNGQSFTLVDSLLSFSNSGVLGIQGSQSFGGPYSYVSFSCIDNASPQALDFGLQENFFFLADESLYGLLTIPSDMDWQFDTYGANTGDYLEFTFSGTYSVSENGVDLGPQIVTGSGRVQRD